MIRYFTRRPLAVLMSFGTVLILGLASVGKVPLSLLPSVDVPQILVRVSYPNTDAASLEENIIKPLRESLSGLNGLSDIESQAGDHTAFLRLTFDYHARMNLAYVAVNEKLDRLSGSWPKDMDRPEVVKVSTADIPVLRIQVTPSKTIDLLQASQLCEKVLRKRLEQLKGVSLVDMNGTSTQVISVVPKEDQLAAMNLSPEVLREILGETQSSGPGLTIRDGAYRFFLNLVQPVKNLSDIASLPITLKDGSVIRLDRIADVQELPAERTGYHWYNGREGIVITVQKQAESRMNELMGRLQEALGQFRSDFPGLGISVTRDQTFLLDAGIGNLYQDLIYGGILTIGLLFLFLGNWASPLLMGISIPLSLIITFVFFYAFGISFNIISLSGLALGVGMLIDNSIVVIDNINRKRKLGLDPAESCITGTHEVVAPVISQVLTTVAVYAPLILLNGLAGLLIFDQCIALTISLGVSLLVAFVLVPVLYNLLQNKPYDPRRDNTAFYTWVSKGYHRMIAHILRRRRLFFSLTLFIMPLGFWLATKIPIQALPKIEKTETLARIDWNEPLEAQANLTRVKALYSQVKDLCPEFEAEVGIQQFLFQAGHPTTQSAEVYFRSATEASKKRVDARIMQWIGTHHPAATVRIIDAPNAFTQLFVREDPYFEARFKPQKEDRDDAFSDIGRVLAGLPDQKFTEGPGLHSDPGLQLDINTEKMNLYEVDRSQMEEALQTQFGSTRLTEVKEVGSVRPVELQTERLAIDAKMQASVRNLKGFKFPLGRFVELQRHEQPRFITADKGGRYVSIAYGPDIGQVPILVRQIRQAALRNGFNVTFSGQYFDDREQLRQLTKIFLLVLLLLYLILGIQYESLIQPFLVMLTIPLGITGGMFLLWLSGSTLDVMAMIGFIVILGLVVDDPILKIETLNKLENEYRQKGMRPDAALLERMIHEAGEICLRPLLMVSLTTSVALVPMLFLGGIGNDLQRPLALVIIGGLTIGTFFTTWFVPLAYWYFFKLKSRYALFA